VFYQDKRDERERSLKAKDQINHNRYESKCNQFNVTFAALKLGFGTSVQ